MLSTFKFTTIGSKLSYLSAILMKYKLHPITFFVFITLFGNHSLFASQGSELHAEQCIDCHARMTGGEGTVLYQRDDSLIHSIDELTARVSHCAAGANSDWDEKQIEAVVKYLNENFYNF